MFSLTDELLVARALNGDRGAFAVIVETYKNVVFAVCMKVMRHHHDAEDLAQEVFLTAYQNLDTLAEPARLRAWLCKIAKYRCLNEMRRRAARGTPEEIPETLASDDATPEETVLFEEDREKLMAGLSSLPEHLRVTVSLRYLHGLSTAETAKKLNIPEGTVKSRLSLGIGKLRKEVFGMNEKKEVGADFVRRVMSMAESLRRYTTSPDFDGKYKKVLEQIDALPDTKEKKEARATALMFASWKGGKISAEERQYIEENKPAKWKISEYIERYISTSNNGKAEDDILAEGLQKARDLGEKDGEGEIRFWMARRLIEKEEYANAATEFEHAAALLSHENSYYPNAIAGTRIAGKLAALDADDTIQAGYSACGETVHFDSEHAYFVSQPGFSGGAYTAQATFNSIFYFASRAASLFYDTTLAVGESIVDGNGNLFTCISRDRTVETPAGVFENCVEYLSDVKKGHDNWVFSAETVYKEGVGLVSIHVKNGGFDETYVLTDFELKGGTGLMPFAVGNRWHYTTPALPTYITCDILREVMFCCEDYAGIAATQFITRDSELEKYADADAAAYIDRGDMFCNELKFREPYDAEKVAAAREAFCRAMQLATTEKDAILAEAALAHLDKRAGYVRAGYRLLPSSVHLDSITRDGENITYAETYYVSPFYIYGRRMIDNKIFGTKIFRWLGEICGTPFDPRWMAALESDEGFTETRTDENGDEVRITARRGGTVATKAGVFQSCIALTIEKGDQDGKFAYYWQPQYCNVGRGRKTYYFAPDVGIVKLECKWGETLSSVCELASYKSVSTSGEYMPFYYGMEWHYEEVTLREKYIAEVNIRIAGGTPNCLLAVYEQNFCYAAPEEEYEAARNLPPKTE